MQWASRKKQTGFTIVELLIVVVVIAILAAITIVAYNGITNRAKDSAVRSTLTSTAKKIEAYRYSADNPTESYPVSLSAAGITSSGDTTVTYNVITSANFYCLAGQNGLISYFVTNLNSTVRTGVCPPVDSLAGWWPLNGTTRNMATADDSAVAVGVSSSDGQNGQTNGSYVFTGDPNGSYIDTKHTSSRTKFTMSAWVYPTASSGYRTPLSEARDCCGSGYRGLDMKTSYGGGTASATLWAGGNGSAVDAASPDVLPLSSWTLLTVTYDGATFSFYKNGILAQSKAYSGDPGTPINSLMIGRAGAVAAGGFAGRIDDVRVYTRALSASEVQNLYQSGAL